MITPRFSCSQTEVSVIVSMYCPSIRAADIEINVDETLLTVHINPYFLRLNFSNNLVEDDVSSANYDPSSGYLTVTLTKEIEGQEFKDLDLLAKLLAPRPSTNASSIEVIGAEDANPEEHELVDQVNNLKLETTEFDEAAENDWQLPQSVPEPLTPLQTSAEKYYGFLDMHSGYLRHATHTENEINELGSDAETCTRDERRKRRIEHEDNKWDEEHYMADFVDDEYIQELLVWEHPHVTADAPFEYREIENLEILRLPCKEYLASPRQTHELYLTLVNLLFSYTYECRTTQMDPTPESAWTMCSLTPAFSALDPPTSSPGWDATTSQERFSPDELIATLTPSYRRCLAFPLYRSFALAEKCRIDTAQLLAKGKRTIMRCLLEMKRIIDHHEVYYVYSKIWLDDFCVWIQAYASDAVLAELSTCLMDLKVYKRLIGWHLEDLEAATQEVTERESDSDDESEGSDSPAPL